MRPARHWQMVGAILLMPLGGCIDRTQARLQATWECQALIAVTRADLADGQRWGIPTRVYLIDDQEADVVAGAIDPRSAEGWRADDDGQGPVPAAALLRRLVTQSSSGYRPCTGWFDLLRQHHAAYGRAAAYALVAKARRSALDKGFGGTIVTFSRPVIDAFGQQAIIAKSGVSSPLGGGGFLMALTRRPDGTWVPVARYGLWIS